MKRIFFLVPLVIIFVVYAAFEKGYLRFNYPGKKEFPVWGIDISHHQKKINWELLKKEKINFVIIKATEGADYQDPKFREYWNRSLREGYETGAYHFYRLCRNGDEQAANYINTVPKSEMVLPPFVDLEYGGNCKTDKSKDEIKQEIYTFLETIKKHYGKTPVLYATDSFYKDYIENDYMEYNIWIRDIISKPKLEKNRKWTFWQYANRGRLKGIEGFVDLNVFHGSEEEYRKFIE
jgi:lysozyme